MGVAKFVNLSFLLTGILLWSVMSKLLALIWSSFDSLKDYAILGHQFALTDVLGLSIAVVTVIVCFKHERVYELATEVASEIKKVTWPTFPETKASTIVVIITTILCSLILGAFDAVWSFVTNLIY